jgi:hypothetical protein
MKGNNHGRLLNYIKKCLHDAVVFLIKRSTQTVGLQVEYINTNNDSSYRSRASASYINSDYNITLPLFSTRCHTNCVKRIILFCWTKYLYKNTKIYDKCIYKILCVPFLRGSSVILVHVLIYFCVNMCAWKERSITKVRDFLIRRNLLALSDRD